MTGRSSAWMLRPEAIGPAEGVTMQARTAKDVAGSPLAGDRWRGGIEQRFDDQLGRAYRFGMVANWEVFRCELHAAVTLVCELDGRGVDPDDLAAVKRLGDQHRRLEFLLEQARIAADPTVDWRGCYETLWRLLGSGGLLQLPAGRPAPFGRAGMPELDDGLSDAMLAWMGRTMFQRDMTQVSRTAPISNWQRFAPVLHRQLTGTWALETRWTDRTAREHRELVATRRQRLQRLLATARQHLDPAADWESFREYLWLHRDLVTVAPSADV